MGDTFTPSDAVIRGASDRGLTKLCYLRGINPASFDKNSMYCAILLLNLLSFAGR